jgi:hypothetical protein
MTTTKTMAVYINNGPAMVGTLSEEQERIPVSSNLPEPDLRWEHTDSHGHFHAHSDDKDDRYPTLERHVERAECDGSCGGVCEGEGYHTVRYTCRICDEEIKPGSIPGPHHHTIPGMRSWTVQVAGPVSPFEKVSVRVEAGDTVYFGIAEGTSRSATSWGSDETTYVSDLVGIGPLGRRKA